LAASRASKQAELVIKAPTAAGQTAEQPSATHVVSVDAVTEARHQRMAREVRRSRLADGRERIILADYAVFAQRAVTDMRRLVVDRWATSGLPTGLRNLWLHRVVSLMHHYIEAERIDAEVRLWCRGVVDPDWLTGEWLSGAYGSSADARHGQADAHLLIESGGRWWDPRYGYSRETLILDLAVTESEMIRLDLQALITEAVRSLRRRTAEGAAPLVEHRRKRRAVSAEEARPWEAEGISRRTWYRRQAERKRSEGVALGATDHEERNAARRAAAWAKLNDQQRRLIEAGVSPRLLGLGERQLQALGLGDWFATFLARPVPRLSAEEMASPAPRHDPTPVSWAGFAAATLDSEEDTAPARCHFFAVSASTDGPADLSVMDSEIDAVMDRLVDAWAGDGDVDVPAIP